MRRGERGAGGLFVVIVIMLAMVAMLAVGVLFRVKTNVDDANRTGRATAPRWAHGRAL